MGLEAWVLADSGTAARCFVGGGSDGFGTKLLHKKLWYVVGVLALW